MSKPGRHLSTLLSSLGLAFTLLALGCGGLSGNVGAGTAPSTVPAVTHVAIVTLENANYADVIGNSNMPYLNSLLRVGSLAANYDANTHPSLPNYFMLTTGLALTNDDGYSGTVTTDNAARSLTADNKTWKVYAESIPSAGYLGGDKGFYLQHHNPFTYFSDVKQSTTLTANIVPFTQFATDLKANTLPNFMFIIPDASNDAHSCLDGSLTSCHQSTRLLRADAWLKANIAPLLANSAFSQSGLLIITFDESADDITNGGGHVATVLVGTHVKSGYIGSTQAYDHRSTLSLTLNALSVTNIPNSADVAPQMNEFFTK